MDERPDAAIMLSHLKRGADRNRSLIVLGFLIKEVNDFFNVKGNMNADQMALTAELILDNDHFYDLTLGNIKACFREKMMSAKLYDRLDGNLIINWLREFKSDMADHVETSSLGKDRLNQDEDSGVISHEVYMAMLEARANDGDEDARKILADYRRRAKIFSPEEQRKKDLDFFRVKTEYNNNRESYLAKIKTQ